MATWHQQCAGIPKPGSGYVMVSDGANVMQTMFKFGEDEKCARAVLANHRKNQPKLSHYLYYNGKLVG